MMYKRNLEADNQGSSNFILQSSRPNDAVEVGQMKLVLATRPAVCVACLCSYASYPFKWVKYYCHNRNNFSFTRKLAQMIQIEEHLSCGPVDNFNNQNSIPDHFKKIIISDETFGSGLKVDCFSLLRF